jgi:hypothetical protein
MDELIRNANDPNFKSLIKKLEDAQWLDDIIDIPAIGDKKRHMELKWSLKGQMCLMTIKGQIYQSALWGETKAFEAALNEQEEAFFHENILSAVPQPPAS